MVTVVGVKSSATPLGGVVKIPLLKHTGQPLLLLLPIGATPIDALLLPPLTLQLASHYRRIADRRDWSAAQLLQCLGQAEQWRTF